MKKIITLLTALVLLVTIPFFTVAEEEAATWSFLDGSINLTVPEKLNQLQGLIYPMDIGEFDADRKLAISLIAYIPLTEEDQEVLKLNDTSSERTEEQTQRLTEAFTKATSLYNFFYVGNGKRFEDVQELILQDVSPDNYNLYELGQAGDYRFYLQMPRPDSEETKDNAASMPENCREEYLDLLKDSDTVIAAITVQKPSKFGEEAVGTVLSFELNDFNGEPVKSEDLFAGHKVTLVNLWASWCGPCAAEMPELEAIWQEYGARGAGVIGICLDGYKEKCLADAKQVAAEGGVTYPMLACTKELETSLNDSVVGAYPTTIFVNEKGEIISAPVIGVQPDTYREILDASLAE